MDLNSKRAKQIKSADKTITDGQSVGSARRSIHIERGCQRWGGFISVNLLCEAQEGETLGWMQRFEGKRLRCSAGRPN